VDPTLPTQVQGGSGGIHKNDESELLEPSNLQLPSGWCVLPLFSCGKDWIDHPFEPGCYISIGDLDQAQKLLDDIPNLLNKKFGGKDLPTEVLDSQKA
jgi:hypothetical protein